MMIHEDDVLVWFSCHRDYFRFRLAELTSIADLLGVRPEYLWANDESQESSMDDTSRKLTNGQFENSNTSRGKHSILECGPCESEGIKFPHCGRISPSSSSRIIEYSVHGTEGAITLGDDDNVFVFVRIPLSIRDRVAMEIIERSVLAKGIAEVIAQHSSIHSIGLLFIELICELLYVLI